MKTAEPIATTMTPETLKDSDIPPVSANQPTAITMTLERVKESGQKERKGQVLRLRGGDDDDDGDNCCCCKF
jgi:hypothetical protein